jgi:hypothetical protein
MVHYQGVANLNVEIGRYPPSLNLKMNGIQTTTEPRQSDHPTGPNHDREEIVQTNHVLLTTGVHPRINGSMKHWKRASCPETYPKTVVWY